ncbi:MAG: hypothetical protein ACKVK5_10780 [Pseudomonadales bacterium]
MDIGFDLGLDVGVLIAAGVAAGRYFWVSFSNRRAVRWALYAEMSALGELISRRMFIEALNGCAAQIKNGEAVAFNFQVTVPKDYNTVYLTHVAQLGSLNKRETMAVVRFYQLVDSAIADVAPTGVLAEANDNPEAFEETAKILEDAMAILTSLKPK